MAKLNLKELDTLVERNLGVDVIIRPARFTILADSAGLDLDPLDSCFDTGSARWIVQQEAESVAQQGEISSTPTFIMDTMMLSGYFPIEEWRPILDSLFIEKTGGQ